jgi:hypothetical protein
MGTSTCQTLRMRAYFCLNGLPVMHSLDLYREEALQGHGGYQTFDAPSVGSVP